MFISILPASLSNRIAAGEVIERPSSALKELLENSLDAGATIIDAKIRQGGKSFISVKDNGSGMNREDIELSILRHATSKIKTTEDLFKISTLGFRGEALPSIASVARLSITSCVNGELANKLSVEGGNIPEIKTVSANVGTLVEVKDLFFATPARLKFLKSDNTEKQACIDILMRLALANPTVKFSLEIDEKRQIIYKANNLKDRIKEVLGNEFIENSVEVNATYQNISWFGFVGLPTYSHSNTSEQFLFVNNRSVKDRLLMGALSVPYLGLMMERRYPSAVLFLKVSEEDVDVNVHPTKNEVRFKDPNTVRGSMIHVLREAISNDSTRTSTTVKSNMVTNYADLYKNEKNYKPEMLRDSGATQAFSKSWQPSSGFKEFVVEQNVSKSLVIEESNENDTEISFPLGLAKAQYHKNWIIAQSSSGIIIIDQHAAHERLTQNKLEEEFKKNNIKRQPLLIPVVLDIREGDESLIEPYISTLEKLGLICEIFGNKTIIVREVPAILGAGANIKQLMQDILSDIRSDNSPVVLEKAIKNRISVIACHSSIRAGKVLNNEEMNALLRSMEKDPLSGQCSHGRPTWIELSLAELEKMFGRS